MGSIDWSEILRWIPGTAQQRREPERQMTDGREGSASVHAGDAGDSAPGEAAP